MASNNPTRRSDGRPLFTRNGYKFDEVASALQKEIRRGHEREALYWALELDHGFSSYLWRRLVIIACEDVGMANFPLVATICALQQQVEYLRAKSPTKTYDLNILAFAILALARSPKSREADHFKHEVMRAIRLGDMKLEIPDYAKDMHTASGRALGRDVRHFWTEGSKVENEAYPSAYRGWDEEKGCAGADGQGRRVDDGHRSGDIAPQQIELWEELDERLGDDPE